MRLPSLSHLQFAALSALIGGPRSGREVRRYLGALDVRRTLAAFYQLMARLEDAKLVEGWYEQEVIAGQVVKERHYRMAPSGARAHEASRRFYLNSAGKREDDDGMVPA